MRHCLHSHFFFLYLFLFIVVLKINKKKTGAYDEYDYYADDGDARKFFSHILTLVIFCFFIIIKF